MKKIVLSLIAASMISSPAFADQWPRQERHHEEHHDHDGGWVGPLLGGLIIGAIITDSTHRDNDDHPYPRRDPYYYRNGGYPDGYGCRFIPSQDRYGNTIYYRVCQ